MRTICEACGRAPAALFCAADEAALCRPCDHKVHMCNKLASRHVRVGLADPSEAPRCDICENAPAFFYCEIDGSSLCLQCDMIVHVGGKRTHGRYLVSRQRIVFPGDKPCHVECHAVQSKEQVETENDHNKPSSLTMRETSQDERHSTAGPLDGNNDDHGKFDLEMIDLNMRPHQPTHAQASNRQAQGQEILKDCNEDSGRVHAAPPFKESLS